jgi:hypothetical protein
LPQSEGLASQGTLFRSQQKSFQCRYYCIYINTVRISCDPAKRDWTLANRGLDFEDETQVFDGLKPRLKSGERTAERCESSASDFWTFDSWSLATPSVVPFVTS